MTSVHQILSWVKDKSKRDKMEGYPPPVGVTAPMPGSKVTNIRASMKLPPIPREERRLLMGNKVKRTTDSPAHIYEEIPYSALGESPDPMTEIPEEGDTIPGQTILDVSQIQSEDSVDITRLDFAQAKEFGSFLVVPKKEWGQNVPPKANLLQQNVPMDKSAENQLTDYGFNKDILLQTHLDLPVQRSETNQNPESNNIQTFRSFSKESQQGSTVTRGVSSIKGYDGLSSSALSQNQPDRTGMERTGCINGSPSNGGVGHDSDLPPGADSSPKHVHCKQCSRPHGMYHGQTMVHTQCHHNKGKHSQDLAHSKSVEPQEFKHTLSDHKGSLVAEPDVCDLSNSAAEHKQDVHHSTNRRILTNGSLGCDRLNSAFQRINISDSSTSNFKSRSNSTMQTNVNPHVSNVSAIRSIADEVANAYGSSSEQKQYALPRTNPQHPSSNPNVANVSAFSAVSAFTPVSSSSEKERVKEKHKTMQSTCHDTQKHSTPSAWDLYPGEPSPTTFAQMGSSTTSTTLTVNMNSSNVLCDKVSPRSVSESDSGNSSLYAFSGSDKDGCQSRDFSLPRGLSCDRLRHLESDSSNDTFSEYDVNSPDNSGNSTQECEYDYYLSKIKQNLLLKENVQKIIKESESSEYESGAEHHLSDSSSLTTVTSLSDVSVLDLDELLKSNTQNGTIAKDRKMHKKHKPMDRATRTQILSDLAKDKNRLQYRKHETSKTRMNRSQRNRRFVRGQGHMKSTEYYSLPDLSDPTERTVIDEIEPHEAMSSQVSDVDVMDRLSCRATDYNPTQVYTPTKSSRSSRGHIDVSKEKSEGEKRPALSPQPPSEGATRPVSQNRLLGDLMKMNHDRQLLYI